MSDFFYFGSYYSPYIVVASSGHGPNTAGKRTPLINGRSIKEFEFNQPTKLKFLAALKRCGIACCDANYEAETKAIDVSRDTRIKRANSLIKCDKDKIRIIYVEIHFNAYDGKFDTNKGGLEVFYYTGSTKGKLLASSILHYLKNGTKQINRGVNSANFDVLKYTLMKAVLSENGFMDDRFEASIMLNENFQTEVAEEHCQGVCDYLGLIYVPPKQVNPKGLYKVQVGAFSNYDNAKNLSNKLKKDGYPTYIVGDDV